MDDFLLFLVVGFVAQVIDGALGMAYGVISSSVLISVGVTPAAASAAIHVAEVFTTGATATSHALNRNVAWKLFMPLALAGVIGGIFGVFVLTSVPGDNIKPFISAYLGLVGLYILWRVWRNAKPRSIPPVAGAPLGLVGGFMDAIGGGGWGPTVSSTMVGAGVDPRKALGTVGASEFFVTCAISATFIAALVTGQWQKATPWQDQAWAVAGLVAGGLLGAPLAGYVVRIAPAKVLTVGVGVLLICLSAYQFSRILAG